MIPYEQAYEIVIDNVNLLQQEEVELKDAFGRYISCDIISQENSPPFDNSAMDGFAVRYEDIKNSSKNKTSRLRVTENIPAGSFTENYCDKGETMRIMTGAPIPEGADTVIPIESTKVTGNFVDIFKPESKGKYVRLKGGDVKKGDILCKKGTLIRAREQALLCSVGIFNMESRRKPTVGILSTGSELVDISEIPETAQIRDVNSILLSSLVYHSGAEPIILERVKDDKDALENALIKGLDYDILITSGGVSVGDHDYIKEILEKIGIKILFWKVKMKPGKPLLFGSKDDTVIFGLPGNTVSCFVDFVLFIDPVIKKMSGARDYIVKKIFAKVQNDLENYSGRDNFMRGYAYRNSNDILCVNSYKKQESNNLESLCKANALIRVPAEKKSIKRFDLVEVYLIDI